MTHATLTPRGASLTIRFWFQVLLGGCAVLLLVVWEHVEAIHLERQMKSMIQEVDRLTYENARMQMQINQWVSPSNLDMVAKKQLSMGPVDPKHIIGVENP